MVLLIILASVLLVGLVLRRLSLALYLPERVALMVAVGVLLGTWCTVLWSLVLPYTFSLVATLFTIAIIVGWLAHRPRGETVHIPVRPMWGAWWVMTTLTAVGFSLIFYIHMLPQGNGAWYTAGPTWGDIAIHLSLISHFSVQPKLLLDFPLFPNTNLTYPFLIDYLSSLFYRSGFSMQLSLLIPALLLVISFAQLFFFMVVRLCKSAAVGVLAMALFFLNGSVAGIADATRIWRESGIPLGRFLNELSIDYIHHPEVGLHIYNVVFSSLLPQRGTLFGFSVFCGVVILLLIAHKRPAPKGLFLAIGTLVGLMPLAHTHTFMVLGITMLGFVVFDMVKRKTWRTEALAGLLLALILASPQIGWQMFSTEIHGFTTFHTGWLREGDQSLIVFWWRNLSILLLVLFASPIVYAKAKNIPMTWLTSCALLLFIAINLISFQPNLYDNSKLLVYSLLIGDVALAAGIAALAKRVRWSCVPLGILVMYLVLPGILSFYFEHNQDYPFVSDQDVIFAQEVQNIVPEGQVLLTADNHNHPVSILSGRPVVMGYRGWLWTYGINYAPVERDVRSMYAGKTESPELLEKYKVRFVVIGASELQNWGANYQYFADRYPIVLKSGTWTVFRITN